LIGVLPTTFGQGVVLNADGTDASPVSRMSVPASFGGYKKLRIAPDGSIWLMLGSPSSFSEPVSLLFRLNGTVTPLAFLVQPASQTVAAGATVTLTASASGAAKVIYQWRRDGVDLAGKTEPTLTLTGFSAALAGDYTVVVSDGSTSLVSRVATLAVSGVTDPFTAWADGVRLSGADADPGADPDHDGANNLAEFYYGTPPIDGAAGPVFVVSTETVGGLGYPAVTMVRRQATDGITFGAAASSSVDFTDDLGTTVVSTTPLGDGFERVLIRSGTASTVQATQFFRFTLQR
jgi:hypothetical protein